MPDNDTTQTTPTTPDTPTADDASTIIHVKSPLVQVVGGQKYQIDVESTADQIKTADGLNVEVRLNTMERALSANTTLRIVETYDEMQALTGLIVGDKVYVNDATGDESVEKGGATYMWQANATFKKVGEDESLDIHHKWEDIEGKPDSDPKEIDLAVAKQHTHSNKETLDKWTDDGAGNPLFDGKRVQDPFVDVAVVSDISEIPSNLRNGGLIIVNPAAAAGIDYNKPAAGNATDSDSGETVTP